MAYSVKSSLCGYIVDATDVDALSGNPMVVVKRPGWIRFFDFRAIGSLWQEARVGAVDQPQNPRRHDPRLDEHLRVLDGDFVQHVVPSPGESLHDSHLVGMKKAATRQPGRIREPDGAQHQ